MNAPPGTPTGPEEPPDAAPGGPGAGGPEGRGPPAAGDRLFGTLAPRVLAALVRRFGSFPEAEDALQEALLAAALRWPQEGLPENPHGWLFRVASRRLIDGMRSESARRRRERAWAATEVQEEAAPGDRGEAHGDDTLVLLFMCCHPALTSASAIALTLRAVGGLTTAEIAAAFLVPEATMAQRISRAKAAVAASRVPFALPSGRDRAARLASVLHVLYLLFNEGYVTSSGPALRRVDLAAEAIRLGREVHARLGEESEAAGLLALMLLTDARKAAREGAAGELIPLAEQDRSRWDRAAIEEGAAILREALERGAAGPYQIQAAIAAVHDEAARPEDTDWPQILALYGLLAAMTDNPMVELNRAIAAAMVHGPATGLRLLEALDGDKRLAGGHRLDAVRAHLHEMAGDERSAVERYIRAAGRTASIPERDYLASRAARLRERGEARRAAPPPIGSGVPEAGPVDIRPGNG